MSRPETWVNLPCTDPIGRVFAHDGRFFRAVYPHKASLVRGLLAIPNVERLMADGLLAKTWIADRRAAGTDLVLEVEPAAFDVPCDRFVASCLQNALDRWIEISLRLDGTGFCLSDAHFGNYMLFGRNEPRWIDLGSVRPIQEVSPDTPFRSFEEFWKGMLAPLLMLRQPSHTRFARLAIADYPYQGPCSSSHEEPLPIHALVTGEREELIAALGAVTGTAAILKAYEFACAKLGSQFVRPAAAIPPSPIDPSAVRRLLVDAGAKRVTCLGGDVYAALAGSLNGVHTLVVDEDEDRLERTASFINARPDPAGIVALQLEHVVNRLFMRRAPKSDAVLAFDPFRRFPHNSDVALENIAAILAELTTKLAVITAPRPYGAQLAQLLRSFFIQVNEEPALADQVTLICRKSHVA